MDDGGCEIDHRLEAAVLSLRIAMRLNSFACRRSSRPGGAIRKCPCRYRDAGRALMLRDYDLGLAFVHVFDDPVGIEGLGRRSSRRIRCP